MTLYWPNDPQRIDLTGPRLHALIIGVGDYPHLKAGAPNAFRKDFELGQLTTTVLTAKKLARWFAEEYRNPAVPLGSIELLLSAPEQVQRPDGTNVLIEAATTQNIDDAFRNRWLAQRCIPQPDGISLFYFAGHGLSAGGAQYLLPSDFGDPGLSRWDNCIDFTKTRIGMGYVKATQLFFVDACREPDIDSLMQANPPTGKRLADDATLFDHPVSEATYYASAEGAKSYGPKDDITYFASALLEALEGAGARKSSGRLSVDTFSLGNAIGLIMGNIGRGVPVSPTCAPQPSGKASIIHVPAAMHVRTWIGCRLATEHGRVSMLPNDGQRSVSAAVGDPCPWLGRVEPGDWTIRVDIDGDPNPRGLKDTLMPPLYEYEA